LIFTKIDILHCFSPHSKIAHILTASSYTDGAGRTKPPENLLTVLVRLLSYF